MNTVTFEITDRIATITLNRPDAANGINYELAQELAHCAKVCDNDDTLKAVIITGNGRFFSAGGDIKELVSHGDTIGPKIKELADSHINICADERPCHYSGQWHGCWRGI